MDRALRRWRTQQWIKWRVDLFFERYRWDLHNYWYTEPHRFWKYNGSGAPPAAREYWWPVDRAYWEEQLAWWLGSLRKRNRVFRRYESAKLRRTR